MNFLYVLMSYENCQITIMIVSEYNKNLSKPLTTISILSKRMWFIASFDPVHKSRREKDRSNYLLCRWASWHIELSTQTKSAQAHTILVIHVAKKLLHQLTLMKKKNISLYIYMYIYTVRKGNMICTYLVCKSSYNVSWYDYSSPNWRWW